LAAVWVLHEGHEAIRDLVRARAAAVESSRVLRQQVRERLHAQTRSHLSAKETRDDALSALAPRTEVRPAAHQIELQEMFEGVRIAKERVQRLECTTEEFVPAWSSAQLFRRCSCLCLPKRFRSMLASFKLRNH